MLSTRRMTLVVVTAFAGSAIFLNPEVFASDSPKGKAPAGLRHERLRHQDTAYDVLWVDPRQASLQLFWRRPNGEPFVNFRNLAQWCAEQGKTLVFATNAGIYAKDRTPLGFHVAQGETLRPLNKDAGGGNFFMKPNGVFFLGERGAAILETNQYAASDHTPTIAVQSGPLLLQQGQIHPRFIPDSDSRYVRNGVGVNADGEAVFVISILPVNFHDFALLFRDRLDCADALYLDGAISGMYAPFAARWDIGLEYVGILAVTERRTS